MIGAGEPDCPECDGEGWVLIQSVYDDPLTPCPRCFPPAPILPAWLRRMFRRLGS